MWARNNTRIKSSSECFRLRDSYSMPDILRKARLQYESEFLKASKSVENVHKIKKPHPPDVQINMPVVTDQSKFDDIEVIEDVEERSLLDPGTWVAIIRMAGHRVAEGVVWILRQGRAGKFGRAGDPGLLQVPPLKPGLLEGFRKHFGLHGGLPGYTKVNKITPKTNEMITEVIVHPYPKSDTNIEVTGDLALNSDFGVPMESELITDGCKAGDVEELELCCDSGTLMKFSEKYQRSESTIELGS